jgi:hypothetical protein
MFARIGTPLTSGTAKEFVLLPGGPMDLPGLENAVSSLPTLTAKPGYATLTGLLGFFADLIGL